MKESVLVHVLPISIKGEKKSFQMKLPKQTKKIIGVEILVRLTGGKGGLIPREMPRDYPEEKFISKNVYEQSLSERKEDVRKDYGEQEDIRKEEKKEGNRNKETADRWRKEMYSIETGMQQNKIVGEIRMQGYDGGDIFYAEEIYLDNSNHHQGNFSRVEHWGKPWTHTYNIEPHPINIQGESTIITGYFKDKFGEISGRDEQYEIKIYLWYQTREENL